MFETLSDMVSPVRDATVSEEAWRALVKYGSAKNWERHVEPWRALDVEGLVTVRRERSPVPHLDIERVLERMTLRFAKIPASRKAWKEKGMAGDLVMRSRALASIIPWVLDGRNRRRASFLASYCLAAQDGADLRVVFTGRGWGRICLVHDAETGEMIGTPGIGLRDMARLGAKHGIVRFLFLNEPNPRTDDVFAGSEGNLDIWKLDVEKAAAARAAEFADFIERPQQRKLSGVGSRKSR